LILPLLGEWLSAVDRHVPGQLDRPTALVAPWSRADLDAVLAELQPIVDGRAPLRLVGWASREDAGRTLKRGALLHADIAAMHRSVDGYSLPSDGRSFVLVNDGQKVGARGGTVHWSFARRLLDLLPPDEDVLLWYRATAAFLQSWDEYSELEPHLKRARELFPRDAALLLYEGALHETYAEPRIQDLFEIPPPRYGRALTKLIGDAKGEWQQAADRFEKRRCLGEPLSPLMDYYASLLLGREEQTLGRREAAREAWARAVALYPGAQSPRLGLSQLARDEGDRASALGALELLNRPRGIEVDPWRTYSRGAHATGVDELFAEMRRRLAP
jgi:hypothetical protein